MNNKSKVRIWKGTYNGLKGPKIGTDRVKKRNMRRFMAVNTKQTLIIQLNENNKEGTSRDAKSSN